MPADPRTPIAGRHRAGRPAAALALLPAALLFLFPGPAAADPAPPPGATTPTGDKGANGAKPKGDGTQGENGDEWERSVPFKPVFYLGSTFSKTAEDFSRQDTYYAITIDVNSGMTEKSEAKPPEKRARQFMQLDLRFTPVVEIQDGQEMISEKKAGYFAFQWYDQVKWLPGNKRCGPPENAGKGSGESDARQAADTGCGELKFDRFSSLGLLAGLVSNPGSQNVPHFIAPMYRGTILEPRGPNQAPNVYGYFVVAPGWWTNYDHKKRVFFEGRFQVARTPLVAGVEANVGRGASDFKFLLAARIEPGKLFKGLGLQN